MDLGTVTAVAQTLFATLQCSELKEILSIFGYKSQLDDLQHTVFIIKAALCDAEATENLSLVNQQLMEELKDVVFEADDLLDAFVTRARQKQLVKPDVCHFFSCSNPLVVAYKMSQGVKKIRKKLDAFAMNKQLIENIGTDRQPIGMRRLETDSAVEEDPIIGRDDDLKKIVGMLLYSGVQHNVAFLSIVGIGGLGKTALAQRVYNDPRVISEFKPRLWTCVSDQDQKQLNVKEVLCKIVASVTSINPSLDSTMDQVQSKLQEQLAGKKFLLVLDDVWTENIQEWQELTKYLKKGQKGSWIVVTTRSQETARIVRGEVHELQGLSKESSWHLFKRAAFGPDQTNPPDDLVEIGREIVGECVGVPLAIRVVGSLLYGEDKSKWQTLQEIGLAKCRESKAGIEPILKLSFDHLESQLKSCFRYCALFPKDFVINKTKLISLWMAQGYIVPFDEGQSIEDAGEEYFSILLRRCFFQDVVRYVVTGEIVSCKIHDLMHDIAQSVSGKEIYATNTMSGKLDKKVRHLSIASNGEYQVHSIDKSHVRSHLLVHSMFISGQLPVEEIVAKFKCLRALELHTLNIKRLPSSIGELLHLRYLNLSNNCELVVLPKSITKLYNLQTLNLACCKKLKELPKDMSRLVKLRLLDIENCEELTYMPRGMGKLTCLQWLNGYKVGGKGSSGCSNWKQWFYGLEDLKGLNNLKGDLEIVIRLPKNAMKVYKEESRREGSYLKSKKFDYIRIHLKHEEEEGEGTKDDEGLLLLLMEELQPHSNLKRLHVKGYHGVKMPGWATSLQNLELLILEECKGLEYLPWLGNWRHLKFLELRELPKMVYIEEDSGASSANSSYCLEKIYLNNLPKLKGWRRTIGVEDRSSRSNSNTQLHQLIPCLSQLKRLIIWGCQELTWIPPCPNVEFLCLESFNKEMEIVGMNRALGRDNSSSIPPSPFLKLEIIEIDNVAWLNSLPMEAFQCLKNLRMWNDKDLVELPEWMQFLPNLQTLEIIYCDALESMPTWMPNLTSLQTLVILGDSESLRRRCRADPPGEDWPYIKHIPNFKINE